MATKPVSKSSDDIKMARLIRAAIFICQGRIDEGEDELLQLLSYDS